MSCLSVKLSRIGGSSLTAERVGGMSARMALVCGSSLTYYDVLYVDEGALLTEDGQMLAVLPMGTP